MKVTIFYLTLPYDVDKLLSKGITQEMIVNFNQVSDLLRMLTKNYNKEKHIYTYLYAFTNNKKYAKRYEELHDMTLFTKIVKEIPKSQYEIFRHENILSEIRELPTEIGDECILCTKSEEYDTLNTLQCLITEEIYLNTTDPYEMFEKKYIKALDILMYCTYNKMKSEDSDSYSYNFSYGISAEGYINGGADVSYNIGAMYIKIFSLLLRKDGII